MKTIRTSPAGFHIRTLAACVLVVMSTAASAQQMDPNMKMPMSMPMPASKPAPISQPAHKKAKKRTTTQAIGAKTSPHRAHPAPASKQADVPAAMAPGMVMPAAGTTTAEPPAAMDMSMPMPRMTMPMPVGATPPSPSSEQSAMPSMAMAPMEPVTPIPRLTDADRAAAAPPSGGHSMNDNGIHSFTLFDRLETWQANPGSGVVWDGKTWIGTDLNRVWLRTEGTRIDGKTEDADLEVLYGRSVAAWWDVVAGIRHDFKPGASQDFAAIGVMGMAPYKFEVAGTAYIGQSGQTSARLEATYDTLLTNRLILQPRVEANLFGRDDARRGVGSGLSTVEAGLRLRYEFTRQFAPYIGVVRERAFGGTADFRRAANTDIDDTRIVAGVRIWF